MGPVVPPPKIIACRPMTTPAASWVGTERSPTRPRRPFDVPRVKIPATEAPALSRPPAMSNWLVGAGKTTSLLIGAASCQESNPASMAGKPVPGERRLGEPSESDAEPAAVVAGPREATPPAKSPDTCSPTTANPTATTIVTPGTSRRRRRSLEPAGRQRRRFTRHRCGAARPAVVVPTRLEPASSN